MRAGRGDKEGRVPDSPFDPPKPKDASVLETAGVIAAGFGAIAIDIATGGVLSTLASIPGGGDDNGPPDIGPLLATIADTGAPEHDGEGNAVCTRCADRVPYASMSLDAHGYFCPSCVAQLTG